MDCGDATRVGGCSANLVAYQMQTVPFVHLDSDVFLWQRLPGYIEAAPVLAQHPEIHAPDQGVLSPGRGSSRRSRKPAAFCPWNGDGRGHGRDGLTAENCGIVGGCESASCITSPERLST